MVNESVIGLRYALKMRGFKYHEIAGRYSPGPNVLVYYNDQNSGPWALAALHEDQSNTKDKFGRVSPRITKSKTAIKISTNKWHSYLQLVNETP